MIKLKKISKTEDYSIYQISFYVPESDLEVVKNAMFQAGAGMLNHYENCAWQTLGTGQFKPIADANPAIGQLNQLQKVAEYKVEMLCTADKLESVIKAMKLAHSYEEVAFSAVKMEY